MISNVIGTIGKAIEGIASNVQKGNSYIIGKYIYIFFLIKYLANILRTEPEYFKKPIQKKKRIGDTSKLLILCRVKQQKKKKRVL